MEPAYPPGKQRLLQAARQMFAERGLSEGSMREICALAKTNVALVKYHFGSKEQLYGAVLDSFLREIARRYPLDEGITPASSPEEKLKMFIRGFLKRLLAHEDPIAKGLSKLVAMEMLSPSPVFEPLLEKHIRPSHERLVTIVSDLMPGADKNVVLRVTHSIAGQCVVYDTAKDIMSQMQPELEISTYEIEHVVDYITEFSLGGIERFRRRGR